MPLAVLCFSEELAVKNNVGIRYITVCLDVLKTSEMELRNLFKSHAGLNLQGLELLKQRPHLSPHVMAAKENI